MKLFAKSMIVLLGLYCPGGLTGGEKIVLPLDSDFMVKAASCNNAEIQIGKLASSRSDSPNVKDFAARLVEDHQSAYDRLAELFKNRKIGVAAGLEKPTKDELSRLGGLRGTEFDRAFLKHMIDEHKKAISVFENQIKKGKEQEVTDYAKRTLPELQKHLKRAEELAKTEGK